MKATHKELEYMLAESRVKMEKDMKHLKELMPAKELLEKVQNQYSEYEKEMTTD